MKQITLDKQQSEIIIHARGRVQVRDSEGMLIGYINPPFTPDQIAEAKRRIASDQPRFTTEQVLEHLRSLEQS